MKNNNYKSWDVNIQSFPRNDKIEKQIEFILNFGLLSPSGHNSQPWKCKINSNILDIYINSKHSLAESDPKQRQLFISFGCFLENINVAADYYGFNINIENTFLNQNSDLKIFSVTFNKVLDTNNNPEHLIFQVPLRYTNRFAYKPELPNKKFLNNALDLNSNTAKITFLNESDQKNKIADIMQEAQIESMESQNFRNELSNYVKSNFTKDNFGMPGFALGIPTLVSLIANKLIKKINLSKFTKNQDLKLLKKFTSTIGIISTTEENKLAWLEAGRILEHFWLLATKEHLVLSVWAAAIQKESFRNSIQKILNTNFLPTIIFRLGKPKIKSKPSPRFMVSDILNSL